MMTAIASMPPERNGGEIEPAVDEAPVREAPAVVAARGVGHVAAQDGPPIEGAGVGVSHRLLDPAGQLPLDPGEVHGLVHGLVPRLLLGGDVDRGLAVPGIAVAAGARVHDLSGAGGIVARRRIGVAALARAVLRIAVAFAGRIGRAVGRAFVTSTGGGGRAGTHVATNGRRTAVAAGIVLLWFRQAIVCLLDTHPVPRLGVGRQGEAGIAQQRVGDELRGELPAFGIALAPARVVLQGAGHDDARHRGLDDVRICVRDPSGRVADLVPVARERLPARIGAEREPERQAPEEGLLAQELGHAVAGALRGLGLHAAGHHAASRAGSTGVTK